MVNAVLQNANLLFIYRDTAAVKLSSNSASLKAASVWLSVASDDTLHDTADELTTSHQLISFSFLCSSHFIEPLFAQADE